MFGRGSTRLLFLNGWTGNDGATMRQLLATYAEQEPQVTIDFQTSDWNPMFAKLDTLLVAGTPPELVAMHATEIPEYANRSALQPVDDWFAQKLLPKEDWSQAVLNKATWNGKIQAIPLDVHCVNTFVSADMLRQAGLDPAQLPIGSQFIDVCQKLSHDQADTAKGTFGIAGLDGQGGLALLWQYDGDVLSADGKKVTFNSQQALDAMQMLSDLIYKYRVHPDPSIHFGDLHVPGRVGYYTTGSWDYPYYANKKLQPPQVIATQFPQIGPKPAVWMNSHELAIPVGIRGEKFAEAQKLIVWVSNHGLDWSHGGHPPARTSQQNSPVLQEDWAWSVRVFAQAAQKYGRYMVSPPRFTQVRALQFSAIDEVAKNKRPVKTILDDYAGRIQAALTQ